MINFIKNLQIANSKLKKGKDIFTVNAALLNAITPLGGIEFKRNMFHFGENLGKVYAIIKYPNAVEIGWLAKFSNIPQASSVQVFMPCDNSALIEHLSRSITQNMGIAESTKEPLVRQRALKAAEDAEKLMRQIDQSGEIVGYMSNFIMATAKSDDELEKVCRRIESTAAAIGCKIRALPNLQKQAFMSVAPFYGIDDEIMLMTRNNVPLSTWIGGMPFASSGFSDRDGLYFAKDSQGGLVTLDIWTREGDRTNSNFVVLGNPGRGKSTAVKHLILSEYMCGTKIICIDPESEMREMCEKLTGDWINCAGGSAGMINPLEIRPLPSDKDDDSSMGAMALHFKTFEVFFKLYAPDLTEIQKAVLKRTLEELYAQFGIGWNTDVSKLKPADFPVFQDLYALLTEKIKTAEKSDDLEYLSVIIRELAHGSDSFLWNGHTSINPKSKFICLDTHDLQEMSDSIKKTQYYNLLTWAWQQMSRDRNEKVLLVADEAHLLVDPNVPQSLIFMRNIAKRARKYEAGLIVISQSVVDFLDPSVKMYGQALMDLPAYKIITGTDGQNLIELSRLYNFTEAERDRVETAPKEYALFMIGNLRIFVHFDIPTYKMEYIGKGGGR